MRLACSIRWLKTLLLPEINRTQEFKTVLMKIWTGRHSTTSQGRWAHLHLVECKTIRSPSWANLEWWRLATLISSSTNKKRKPMTRGKEAATWGLETSWSCLSLRRFSLARRTSKTISCSIWWSLQMYLIKDSFIVSFKIDSRSWWSYRQVILHSP